MVNLVKAQIVFNDITSVLPDAGTAAPDALAPAPADLAAIAEGSSAAAPDAVAAEAPGVAGAPVMAEALSTATGVIADDEASASEAPSAAEVPSRRRRLRELGFRFMLRALDALSAMRDPRPPPQPARFLMEDEKIGPGSWLRLRSADVEPGHAHDEANRARPRACRRGSRVAKCPPGGGQIGAGGAAHAAMHAVNA